MVWKKKIFEMEGVELVFEEEALKAIARKSLEKDTGARALRSIIENTLASKNMEISIEKLNAMLELVKKEKAVSKVKAKGLMQLMDETAREMGVSNSFDPKANIFGGTKYIATMLRKFDGDIEKSLAAYNAGPHNVEKYGGIPPFKETQNYVTRVLGYLNHFEEY